MEDRITKTIHDDRGETHEYAVLPFNPEMGLDILTTVLQVASEPLGQLANALKGGDGSVGVDDVKEGLSSLLDERVDAGALGSAVHSFLTRLQTAGGSKLIRRILAQTWRDGKQLSDDAMFNRAYRANYGEMFRAVLFVLSANYREALQILQNPTGGVGVMPR